MFILLKRKFAHLLGRALKKILSFHDIHDLENVKRQMQSCGEGVFIKSSTRIVDPRSVAIGSNVHIGEDCFFFAEGGLQIQDNVHISRRVTIYCSDHDFRGELLPYGPERVWSQVVIERNAWIGMNVCILPGVRIGEGAIIGMGAVVAKDVAPRAIVVQQPYRLVGERSLEAYRDADTRAQYGGAGGKPIAKECNLIRSRTRARYAEIAFVVSTGRSGSGAIVDLLRQHSRIKARHEPRPQLIKWSTEYEHGELSRIEIKKLLRELFLETSVFEENIVHVESDQKYFNLISILAEILPKAKFIWLTRSAKSVIASTVGRGWYDEGRGATVGRIPAVYSRNRLSGANIGQLSSEQWSEMSAFEKNCWYWGYVNKTIEESLRQIGESRSLHVRLEDLEAGVDEILQFLSVCPEKLRLRRTNRAFYEKYSSENWDEEQNSAFELWCGRLQRKLYPTEQ